MLNKSRPRPESILILGLGGVGAYLAKRLVHEGYAITVIESEGGMIRHADGSLDARLIQGNAMSIACLREAGAEKMDFLRFFAIMFQNSLQRIVFPKTFQKPSQGKYNPAPLSFK